MVDHWALRFGRHVWLPRPYDLHSAQIKKSDDLDNACAKSLGFEALLAQAVAMQIISNPGMSRAVLHGVGSMPWFGSRL
jgi:hypothetical protein